MLARSHLLFSVLLLVVFWKFRVVDDFVIFSIFVLFFTLLPDIDTYKSYLGKKVWFISFFFKLIFGHRGVFHAVYIPLIFFFGFTFLGFYEIGLGGLVGYCSHLLLDAMTESGIRPFYPLRFRLRGFFRTNGWFELIFNLLCAAVIVLFFIM